MRETTPLKKSYRKYKSSTREDNNERPDYDEEQQYEEYEDSFSMSNTTKYTLFTIIGLITLLALYFFTVFLPGYFIPEAVALKPIENISDIPVTLVSSSNKENNEATDKREVDRIILIGDIHGHYIEFRKLLTKIHYNKHKDHLIVLGDFISKGPDSFKTLNYLINNNIDCVLGNHEYYILQNYATFHGLDQPNFSSSKGQSITIKDSFNDDPEFLLAKKLEPHQVKYINNCSIIKKLGYVPNPKGKSKNSIGGDNKYSQGIAVHAGIRPDLPLDQQDPIDNLEMRSLVGPFYNETTSDPTMPNSKSWSKIYNSKNGEYPADYIVYYGHDAGRGLKIKKFTKGLDSRCDRNGKLSAMVISKQEVGDVETNDDNKKKSFELVEEVFQVNC
ncbi:calcineurin-like phosphoesterase, putative [Candida dubliniensis CD36]|uniref:Metallophosphoesterase, putative n=1 Tax=Candida dubliniensis (strain CD36 / ATCC MYA-646 / CBS 7987 / NCPF 3949 / NRRL Y-17841) TaxID=573826 RepID=B9WJT1_CANDC|nr:calcineurin-like phosphoesterase, putative [Candida dubliniensis CD36]CAX40865.1 calcineurin-like phosphoesterase, putative [Candida dubliniensis CD36]